MRLMFLALCLFASTSYAYDIVNGHHTGLINMPLSVSSKMPHISPVMDAPLPDSYDSRTLGFVAPIKDQGQCGSCWDFSMTKTYESARLVAGMPYIDFAEQDVLVNDKNAAGCQGGMMDAHYFVDHGVALEKDCPYTANDGDSCSAAPADKKATKWAFVGAEGRAPTKDELKAAIYLYKVISITVAAGGSDWDNGGHMTGCDNTGINHMVNLVGWNGDEFIGANSWGTSWGDHGFFYAKQGCNQMASDTDSALVIVYDK